MPTPQPPSKIWGSTSSAPSVDSAVVQDANYRLNRVDRSYIDSQIRAVQQHLVQSLIGGLVGTWATLDGSSAAVAIGDVLCSAGNGNLTRGTSGAIAAAGGAHGIALSAAAPGNQVRVAIGGLVPSAITGLPTSGALQYAVPSSGRVATQSSVSAGNIVLGTVDAGGNLTLNVQPSVGGSGGGGGGQFNVTLANGLNSSIATTGLTVLRIGGPSAAFSIGGFTPPANGTQQQDLVVWNTTSQTMTIVHEDTSTALAGWRLTTINGNNVDTIVRGGSLARFTYDSTLSRWVLTSIGYTSRPWYDPSDYGAYGHSVSNNQPAIQAAINAAIADPGRRVVLLPRDPSGPGLGNNFLNITAPIEIVGSNAFWLEGENWNVTLRAIGFYGPAVMVTPVVTAPTPTQDTTGWWGFATSGGAFLPLNLAGTTNLDGLSAFCCEFWIKATLGTANGTFLSSNGQRGLSEAATTAFQCGVTNLNKISLTITTSITGVSTYISTATVGNGVRTAVRIAFDQTTAAVRVYIGGVYDGAITLSAGETIVQGWEDLILNAGGGNQWPLMTGRGSATIVTGCFLYSLRLSNVARSTTTSSYSPSTTELTVDANTLLLLNFDPNFNGTSATSAAGMIQGQAQVGSAGINGPVYLPWETGDTIQDGPVTITNLGVQCASTAGIWVQRCPNTRIESVQITGNGPVALALYDNCYLSHIHDLLSTFTAKSGTGGGAIKCPKWANVYCFAGGPNHFSDLEIVGGDIGLALCNCAVHVEGTSYILPQGHGGVFIKAIGDDVCVLFDQCFVGDEAKLQSDFGIMLVGPAGTITSFNVNVTQGSSTIVGVGTHWTNFGGPIPGLQWTFASQPGVIYTVQSITDDTHIVLGLPGGTATPYTGNTTTPTTIQVPRAGGAGLHTRFNGGTPQLLSSSAPLFLIDGGTCHQIDCETWQAVANAPQVVVKFLKAPDDMVTILGTQNTIFSAGAQTPWMPENGSAGQGPLLVESLRQGKVLKYPCPDSTFNIPVSTAMSSTLAAVGVLTATRTHLLPLIAGYVWDIDNSFQTGGAHQSVTYQCTSNGTSGTLGTVTIAADKRARIACYDTSVGLIRLTADQ